MDLLSHQLPHWHFFTVWQFHNFYSSYAFQEKISIPRFELIASFLLDSVKPGVRLSTSSPNVTKESEINVIVEFTKPVFGFEASMVEVIGGRITRQSAPYFLFNSWHRIHERQVKWYTLLCVGWRNFQELCTRWMLWQ